MSGRWPPLTLLTEALRYRYQTLIAAAYLLFAKTGPPASFLRRVHATMAEWDQLLALLYYPTEVNKK
jgi:hypothetical protein